MVEKAQSRLQSLVRDQPLAVTLACLVAGAAVAAALLATTRERRALGPARRQRVYEAPGTAREKITEATVAAGERRIGTGKERGVSAGKQAPGELASGISGEQKDPPSGAGDAFATQSGTDLLKPDFQREGEKSSEEPKPAKAILDAEQKAVDDIRAGRPAPYYFTPPNSTVATPATSAQSSSAPDNVKK